MPLKATWSPREQKTPGAGVTHCWEVFLLSSGGLKRSRRLWVKNPEYLKTWFAKRKKTSHLPLHSEFSQKMGYSYLSRQNQREKARPKLRFVFFLLKIYQNTLLVEGINKNIPKPVVPLGALLFDPSRLKPRGPSGGRRGECPMALAGGFERGFVAFAFWDDFLKKY